MLLNNNTNGNYTMRQLKLPLEIEKLIDISDPVYTFCEVPPHQRELEIGRSGIDLGAVEIVGWVNYYCAGGRIPGAVKMAGVWLLPKTAEKPTDRRRKEGKKNNEDSLN